MWSGRMKNIFQFQSGVQLKYKQMEKYTKDDFIDWLGLLYLDFQNESQEWRDIARKEIKEEMQKLKI